MSSENGIVSIRNDLMISVPKTFFVDGMVMTVPVFLRIKDGSYLLICGKGNRANFTHLHSFNNPAALVCVTKEDYPTLIDHLNVVTKRVIEAPNAPLEMKAKFLMGLTNDALASFEGKGVSPAAQLQKVSNFVLTLHQSVESFDEILALLQSLPNDEAKHSITTTMIALMIADEMQVKLKAALEKLALGCMLHDMGLKYLPQDLLKKPKHLWTAEDNALYETHPVKAVEMLRDLKDVSNDVLLIIVEHHENAIGTGYPKKIRDMKISPLGRIAALADCFSELLFNRGNMGKNYNSDEAISYIEEVLGQPFNKGCFAALKNMINKKFLQDRAKSS